MLDSYFAQIILGDISKNEAEAIAIMTIFEASRVGYICLNEETAYSFCQEIYKEKCELVRDGLKKISTKIDINSSPIVQEDGYFFLRKNYLFKKRFLENVKRLASAKVDSFDFSDLHPSLSKMGSFTLINGGPGSGKTYLITRILEKISQNHNFKIVVGAPTGKAVSVLKERILGFEEITFGTLHSLLGIGGISKKSKGLLCDFCIVDEVSMIEASLFAELLSSLKAGTRVILVGDENQLPPVGSIGFFSDLLKNKEISKVKLEGSKRSEGGDILKLAQFINSGECEAVLNYPQCQNIQFIKEKELFFKIIIEKSLEKLFFKNSKEPTESELLDKLGHFGILSCLRKGIFGVDILNQIIRDELKILVKDGEWWIEPIILTKSKPDLNLYNGDLGFLVRPPKAKAYVIFPKTRNTGKNSVNPTTRIEEAFLLGCYEYAYCLSVHKSQGSEYREVLVIVADAAEFFGREILYTAVTRAKQKVHILGSNEAISKVIKRSSQKS